MTAPVAAPAPPADGMERWRHIPALDGLRGVAVVAVLLFHAGYLRGGYLGVDAFFVLSGFLITSLLLDEVRRSGRVDLRAFWGRRARRLLPAMFAVVLAVAAYAALVAGQAEQSSLRGDALATLAYVFNWRAIYGDASYWELFSAPSPLSHMWSLAIEEQFYLVWPLLVGGLLLGCRHFGRGAVDLPRRLGRTVFVVSVVLALASTATMWLLYTPGGPTDRVYMGSDTRAAGILVGAALAAATSRRRTNGREGFTAPRVLLEVVGLASVAALAIAWTVVDGRTPGLYRGGFLLCGLAAAAVIAAAAHPRPGVVARAFSVLPLRWLGAVSYGLYLWHWPTYVVLDGARTGLDGPSLLAVRLGASAALAVVSYHLVEQPIRLRRVPLVRARLGHLAVAGPVMALVCAVAVVAATWEASPARSAGAGERDLEVLVPAAGPVAAATPTSAAPGPRPLRRLLLVGDSVSGSVADGARHGAAEQGVGLAVSSVENCRLDDRVTDLELVTATGTRPVEATPTCTPAWNRAVAEFDPDAVVLVYGNAGGLQRFLLDGSWVDACAPEFAAWYEPTLAAEAEVLAAGGADLHIATLPPHTSRWLPDDAAVRLGCVDALNRKVATAGGHRILELAAFVCPGGVCREAVDGQALRYDGIHFGRSLSGLGSPFGGPGADEVGSWVVRAVVASRTVPSL
ncbi:MAG: acyltransferase family protein [Acidimicrobiales bacterium]